jgi:hypothetical protein
VDVHATEDVEALGIPPDHLRRLMLAERELGDRIMRALILRRAVLIKVGARWSGADRIRSGSRHASIAKFPGAQRSLQGRGYPSARTMEIVGGRRVRDARWVDWFNHRRLLEPVGNIPQNEAEQQYFATLDQMKIA